MTRSSRGFMNGSSARRARRRARDQRKARSQTDLSGKTAADETARTLFLRGRESEAAGDPGGALDLYARALALTDAGRDPADTATILHHIGDCSALLGDKSLAWETYLSAARLFHERCDEPNVGASLGKAGLLLVEFRPPVPIREAITHAVLLTGLAGVLKADHADFRADVDASKAARTGWAFADVSPAARACYAALTRSDLIDPAGPNAGPLIAAVGREHVARFVAWWAYATPKQRGMVERWDRPRAKQRPRSTPRPARRRDGREIGR